MSLIEVDSLYKNFKMGKIEVEVIKNISLTVEEGEFVSIMGPSGSGKSTLLYLMGGLDKPTKGSVLINGVNIAKLRDKKMSIMRRRDIGFVFQFFNLVPNLNVSDNIMLPILLDGKRVKPYRKKLDDILEIVGLSNRQKHKPRELSGGQQQRVAIARALINEPSIILADEPTGNLDSKTSDDILTLFQVINQEHGKTIVQVTHDDSAASYGTRMVILKDGKIICDEAVETASDDKENDNKKVVVEEASNQEVKSSDSKSQEKVDKTTNLSEPKDEENENE